MEPLTIIAMILAFLLLLSIYCTVFMIFNIARCFAERVDYGFMVYILLALSIWADVMLTIFLCITFFAGNS